MIKKINYFRRLIDENDPASVKRFAILAVLLHYIITGYVALFMEKSISNIALVTTIMDYNFYMILMGVFGLTVESVFTIFLEKAKIMVKTASPITIENAESANSTTKDTSINNKI